MSEQVRSTACPLDCPDSCSLEVTVDAGTLTKVDGDRRNPFTQDFICGKVRNIADHVYGQHRLRYPLIRTGPKGTDAFRRASWDEALDLIANRLIAIRDGSGGEAIVPCAYGGSNGALTDGCVDERLWRRLGASRVHRDLCAKPTGRAAAGMHGSMLGVALDDHLHAKLIVVWGANPASSGIHHVPFVKQAQERGAKLVVVDPRRVGLAARADLHLAVRPGTDLPVALAIARWLFENGHADEGFIERHVTGVDAFRAKAEPWTLKAAAEVAGISDHDLLTLATWFAESSPAVVRCGWGLERNRNGGSAACAVMALPAIAGKFGVRGGGFSMSNSKAVPLEKEAAINAVPRQTRTLSQKKLGAELLQRSDPPIEALFVYNANILATAPRQDAVRTGLSRENLFTVVFDQVMTDTARLADVVLPATTFLEHEDLRVSYGICSVADVTPVIDPVGESRSNTRVFAELVKRCGLERPDDKVTPDALRAVLVGGSAQIMDGLDERGVAAPTVHHPIQFVDAFPATPDGKFHLHPDDLDDEAHGLYVYKPDPASESYPLAMITPSSPERVTSTFGQLQSDLVPMELHPDDMNARGLSDGDAARAFNDIGSMRCVVAANDNLPRGVATQPKGLWSHNTACGNTNNALCPDTDADLGRGACYNDARIQVERIT